MPLYHSVIIMSSCESASRSCQPGEGPRRGLLRDCEIFANISLTFVWSSIPPLLTPCLATSEAAAARGGVLPRWGGRPPRQGAEEPPGDHQQARGRARPGRGCCYDCTCVIFIVTAIAFTFNIACQARKCHGQLQKTLLELEDEINKKCNSIYIDEVKCSTLRKSISINCYWGYWIETMGWVLDLDMDMDMDMIKYRNESLINVNAPSKLLCFCLHQPFNPGD